METDLTEINLSKKFLRGDRWRAPGRRTFAVFNHARNGTLCTQWFEDIFEMDHRDLEWRLVEPAREKIAAFRQQAWVTNVTEIPGAKTAEQALAVAKEKFNMQPLEPVKKKEGEK